MKPLPDILTTRTLIETRLFRVEEVDLRFSNGQTRCYERLRGRGQGAVMILPMLDETTMLLVREYAVGVEAYDLGFPKGRIDSGETPEEAAVRELQEEVGYGAKRLTPLKALSASPGFFGRGMLPVIAQDLYPATLEGDEPEPLEVVPWDIRDLDKLLAQEDFTDARSVSAAFLLREYLASQK